VTAVLFRTNPHPPGLTERRYRIFAEISVGGIGARTLGATDRTPHLTPPRFDWLLRLNPHLAGKAKILVSKTEAGMSKNHLIGRRF